VGRESGRGGRRGDRGRLRVDGRAGEERDGAGPGRSDVLRVGLTGGIGSGKSEVSKRLASHGAVIIDADEAARRVVDPGTPGLASVVETFGPGVLTPDGELDRERVGAIIFADAQQRARLNAIVHPLVRQWMAAAEAAAVARDGGAVIVHDVPLLAENGLAPAYDLVIVVDTTPEAQLDRLTRLRGMALDQARARIAAQATRQQRRAIASIVIPNTGSLADLDRQVTDAWEQLRKRAAAG
jgi:dephospho-CoA kinase